MSWEREPHALFNPSDVDYVGHCEGVGIGERVFRLKNDPFARFDALHENSIWTSIEQVLNMG